MRQVEEKEEESEEDYLSDKFLKSAEEEEKKKKRKREKSPPKRESAEEKRLKALSTMISSDNKGYQLLKKLGFEEGKGIGKNKQGITEPLPLSSHKGTSGLGVDSEKRKQRSMQERREKASVEKIVFEFKDLLQRKEEERRVSSHRRKAFNALVELETRAGLTREDSQYVRTFEEKQERMKERLQQKLPFVKNITEEEEEETLEDLSNSLREMLCALQEKYLFCIYCGITFNDQQDLEQNCPGILFEDH